MPLQFANPVWVDDDAVDLDHHVQRVTLPPPGTMTQFDDCVGRLHAELLDRSRPLWRLHVIDGLESGQVGYYFKAHHAALDGQAGIAAGAHAVRPVAAPAARVPRAKGAHGRRASRPGRARRRRAAPRRRPVRQARAPPARRGAHPRRPARPGEGGRRAGPAAAELRLRPADAAERADHRRARLRRPVAAARRAEGAGRRARRQAQRHRAGAVQRRAAPLPGAPRRHPEEAADGGDADLAARGRQHRLHDAGDDAARQPAHAHRRPGAAPARDPRRRRRREGDGPAGQGRGADGLPVDRRALGAARPGRALWPVAPRRRDAGAGQRRDLEHPGAAGAAVRGRRAHERLLAGVDRRARPGAEHHRDQLRRGDGLRLHDRARGGARRAPADAGAGRGLRGIAREDPPSRRPRPRVERMRCRRPPPRRPR